MTKRGVHENSSLVQTSSCFVKRSKKNGQVVTKTRKLNNKISFDIHPVLDDARELREEEEEEGRRKKESLSSSSSWPTDACAQQCLYYVFSIADVPPRVHLEPKVKKGRSLLLYFAKQPTTWSSSSS